MEIPFAAFELRILLIAVTASMMIGGLWHGLIFHGERRRGQRRLDGRRKLRPPPGDGNSFLVFFFADLMTAVALSWLLLRLGLRGAAAGALLGLIVWFGLIAPSGLARRPQNSSSWAIEGGRELLSLIAMGAVLGAWGV